MYTGTYTRYPDAHHGGTGTVPDGVLQQGTYGGMCTGYIAGSLRRPFIGFPRSRGVPYTAGPESNPGNGGFTDISWVMVRARAVY